MTGDVIDIDGKRLQRMEPRQVVRELMMLSPRQRMNLILDRPDAEQVVAAMPEQDFFVSVKEIGPSDALPLLALAQLDQLHHVFDIEWWDKDQVSPARALQWLSLLAQASEEKMAAWLFHADFELLVTLGKKWIRVETAPDDVDLTEVRDRLPKYTIDDQYFWESRYPQYHDFIRSILIFLFETHRGFYREFMNHILYAPDAELQEDAYRFHRGRLEDRAIPDFYDALEIYRNLEPDDIDWNKRLVAGGDVSAPAPAFALAGVPDDNLLQRALARVRSVALVDTLQWELASLANKVVVADRLPPDDPYSLQWATSKVAAYLGLGLDLLTRGREDVADKVLKDVHLEHLFRCAATRIKRLNREARKLLQSGWLRRATHGVAVLDEPWREHFDLLLESTPQVKREGEEDFFRTRRDLFLAQQRLQAIAAIGPIHAQMDRAGWLRHLDGLTLWREAQIQDPEDITLGVVLFTAAANQMVGNGPCPHPLDPALWPQHFERLDPDALEAVVRAWIREQVSDSARRQAFEPYLRELIDRYREEMQPFFATGEPPNPKLVTFFLFRRLE